MGVAASGDCFCGRVVTLPLPWGKSMFNECEQAERETEKERERERETEREKESATTLWDDGGLHPEGDRNSRYRIPTARGSPNVANTYRLTTIALIILSVEAAVNSIYARTWPSQPMDSGHHCHHGCLVYGCIGYLMGPTFKTTWWMAVNAFPAARPNCTTAGYSSPQNTHYYRSYPQRRPTGVLSRTGGTVQQKQNCLSREYPLALRQIHPKLCLPRTVSLGNISSGSETDTSQTVPAKNCLSREYILWLWDRYIPNCACQELSL